MSGRLPIVPHQAAHHKILWFLVDSLCFRCGYGAKDVDSSPKERAGEWRRVESPEDTGDNRCERRPYARARPFRSTLHDVPHEELEAAGIRGLIVDLDNTLLGSARRSSEKNTSPGWPGARTRF